MLENTISQKLKSALTQEEGCGFTEWSGDASCIVQYIQSTLHTAFADIPGGEGWALSALEAHYRKRAQALGFQTDLHIVPPQGWETGIPDLCLVLSNLLENSLEALQREGGGWMRARSMSTAGYFSLVVVNSCTRPLRSFNGHYLSSKAPGRRGIGLDTVREVAQRWGGQADFKVENGEFRASVFLPRTTKDSHSPPTGSTSQKVHSSRS